MDDWMVYATLVMSILSIIMGIITAFMNPYSVCALGSRKNQEWLFSF